jgi:hypothetical protein
MRRHSDDGAVTLYVVLTVTALMAAFGFVVDVGGATVAKGKAIHNAYAAARAGAEAMSNESFVTTGRVLADPVAARRAALIYLTRVGAARDATVTVSGATVRVDVRVVQRTGVLSMFGLDQITVTGDGSATAVYGQQGIAP